MRPFKSPKAALIRMSVVYWNQAQNPLLTHWKGRATWFIIIQAGCSVVNPQFYALSNIILIYIIDLLLSQPGDVLKCRHNALIYPFHFNFDSPKHWQVALLRCYKRGIRTSKHLLQAQFETTCIWTIEILLRVFSQPIKTDLQLIDYTGEQQGETLNTFEDCQDTRNIILKAFYQCLVEDSWVLKGSEYQGYMKWLSRTLNGGWFVIAFNHSPIAVDTNSYSWTFISYTGFTWHANTSTRLKVATLVESFLRQVFFHMCCGRCRENWHQWCISCFFCFF